MSDAIDTLSQELSRGSIDVLSRVARANRGISLEAFGPVVRCELFAFLLARFPLLPEMWVREMLAEHVIVTSQRIAIDFDAIAMRIVANDEPPDTERPA